MRRFLSMVLAVSAVACRSRDIQLTPPRVVPDISGNWSGTITSALAGNGTISLTQSQMCLILLPPGQGCQPALSGTWSASFPNSVTAENGSLSGQVSESTVTFGLSFNSSSACPIYVSATLADSTSMHGTYTQFHTMGNAACTGIDSGTVSLTKH